MRGMVGFDFRAGILGRLLAIRLLAVVAALSAGSLAHAIDPAERLQDPRLEERARALSAELRCLVCQNQSIDDSDAPLAKDLRLLVRERLATGATDAEVKQFIVARYGDFVLLKPPFNTHTLLLWFTPLIVLALIGVFVWRALAARSSAPAVTGTGARLSAEEEARLQSLLGSGDDASRS